MEVHSHTHTPGKKWTHSLWEFLMLFLVVFCGFLAENMRDLTGLDNYNANNFYDLALPAARKLEPISADGQMLKLLYIKVVKCKIKECQCQNIFKLV